jgi:16S rRNA (guanine527-N7)-methyltransferase
VSGNQGADRETFTGILEAAGCDDRLVVGCWDHFQLLQRWNRTHNLTRITDVRDAAVRHYLDCALPVRQAVEAGALADADAFIDVGSGAGFPGLIAALALPTVDATLVEPARKRASFLRVAAGALGLSRVRVVAPSHVVAPWVVSRATFSASARQELWGYVAPGGRLWAWTTPAEQAVWADLVRSWDDARLSWVDYSLPGLGRRVVASIERMVR